MQTIDGKCAVITGAASGMGRAMAERFGRAGASVVLADVEEPALDAAVAELRAEGITATGVVTDVSDAASMDALAAAALDAHGTVNIVCNNAGVGGGGPLETLTVADWEWVLGVNLWGVIHGIRVFLPHLLEHGDGHVVNTASIAGHTSYPNMAPYNASKHAVVTISETLYNELRQRGSGVGASVLCPGLVNTNIVGSERNRPERLRRPGIPQEPTREEELRHQAVMAIYEQAVDPAEVANRVHDAILGDQFYIWTDGVYAEAIRTRHEDIDGSRNPTWRGDLWEEDQTLGR